MAQIEDIFQRFRDKILLNKLECSISSTSKIKIGSFPAILKPIQINESNLLFRCDKNIISLTCDEFFDLDVDYAKNNYLYWIEEKDWKPENNKVVLSYMKCGTIKSFDFIDIGYERKISHQLHESGKSFDEIEKSLFEEFVFDNNGNNLLFIETYSNGSSDDGSIENANFAIHGLESKAVIKVEDGKWLIDKIVSNSPLTNNFDYFLSYDIVIFDKVNFVDKLRVRTGKILEQTGQTLLQIWQEYSDIEKRKALDFKDKLGKLNFTSASPRKNGVTIIKLEPTYEQECLIKENNELFTNSSFNISESNKRVSFRKPYNKFTKEVEVYDDKYPFKDSSGFLTVNTSGDETVYKRRNDAFNELNKRESPLVNDVWLAIENQTNEMMKTSEHKNPITANTKKFIKEKFNIDNLTEDQEKAVKIAINTPDIALIQGPPGTGKSTVVAVICHRLIEEAKKRKTDDKNKVILVSAFQNETVEHIASKIETFGIPSSKIGKGIIGIDAEKLFIEKMRNNIDNSIKELNASCDRWSYTLFSWQQLLHKEKDLNQICEKINAFILSSDISDDLRLRWENISKQINDRHKLANLLKSLPTDIESYTKEGYNKVVRLYMSEIEFTDDEKERLSDPPYGDNINEDFLCFLKDIQDKYLPSIEEKSFVDSIEKWLNDACVFFKNKEASEYKINEEAYLAANLENIKEDLNSISYVKNAIRLYGQCVAATNQIAGDIGINKLTYENVILEEAARSNPLDLLIPMVRANKRIILVGDQKQLPHLIEDDILDEVAQNDLEKRQKYEETLFNKLFENLKNTKPERCITLTEQFRMHPVIGKFISDTYYESKISSKHVNIDAKTHNLEIPWAKNKVAVFCDVPQKFGAEKPGRSKERDCEAKRVVELLDQLHDDPQFKNLSIGIISFYRNQVEKIQKYAENKYTELDGQGNWVIKEKYKTTADGREKLRIGSVDSFQGKEFDVVILSTVRSNNIERTDENSRKIFGFLNSENRLNVAFSRAQKLLIVVGDYEMFTNELANKYVRGLYEFCAKLIEGEYGGRI